MNPETKICQNCKQNFVIEPDDFAFYEKIKVPPPTFCPECRMIRRMTWRNERTLYKRNCDLCGKNFFSVYKTKEPFPVYCRECWYSDKWDPLDYGFSYNFEKPFFSQFAELWQKVPHSGILHYPPNVNVDYSYSIDESRNIYDSFNIQSAEMIYENIDCDHNNKTLFFLKSRECLDSSFLFNCSNCQSCFMSSNLRGQKHVFRNKQFSKEEYENKVKSINLGSFNEIQKLKEEFKNLIQSSLHKYSNIIKSVNCTGDNIRSSKNCKMVFNTYNTEDSKYSLRILNSRDCYDILGAAQVELMCEYLAGGYSSYKSVFSMFANNTRESFYTDFCHDSGHMFGSIGVRKKEYCILNKQYTKEQYEELVPKIIQHMNDMPYVDSKGRIYKYGEFFPTELSPFAYNETVAQEYFPLTKEQALEQGYKWKDKAARNYKIEIKTENLPDNIKDVNEDIINKVIECAHYAQNEHPANCEASCTEAFKIISDELQFYRRMNLPLPRLCPNCRHYERLKQRNPLKLWHRSCMCAGGK